MAGCGGVWRGGGMVECGGMAGCGGMVVWRDLTVLQVGANAEGRDGTKTATVLHALRPDAHPPQMPHSLAREAWMQRRRAWRKELLGAQRRRGGRDRSG